MPGLTSHTTQGFAGSLHHKLPASAVRRLEERSTRSAAQSLAEAGSRGRRMKMAKQSPAALLVVAFAAAAALICSCPAVVSARKNGVRGLMLDMYDFRNDIWLCHSYGGACRNFTAFTPAVNVLREIEVFLRRNPSEVITIFIEDYVEAPMGLTRVFKASGLTPYLFPVWRMPKNGGDWPLLSDMVRDNHRLLVFTSRSAKEAAEGFAHEWGYVVENQYGSKGMVKGSCPNRAESAAMNDLSRSLVLVNYFRDLPNFPEACKDNSGPHRTLQLDFAVKFLQGHVTNDCMYWV